MDLHLSISGRLVSCKSYDKRDDFHFKIVNYTFCDVDVSRSTSYGVYILKLIRFVKLSSLLTDFIARNKISSTKRLHFGYRYHKIRKTFLKFHSRHCLLVLKLKVGLKFLLQQDLSEPELFGELVYKLRNIVSRIDFSD